jgi:hypothetical protein
VTDLFPARLRRAVLLPALIALSAPCSAEPRELPAKVIWVRESRVYLASPDSAVLQQGALVTLVNRGKPVAAGAIERVHDGTVAVVRLTSGSLARVKKLDRLRVLAEPPRFVAPPLLRVGVPARQRSSLLFACSSVAPSASLVPGVYRVEGSAENSWRLVRNAEVTSHAAWPDTLVVQLFQNTADQEIALERSELDVAVFWPGKLSAHMREDPRWQGPAYGQRGRGLVAAFQRGTASRRDSAGAVDSLVSSLNQQLFRGDLAAWPPAAAGTAPISPHSRAGRERDAGRYSVDPSLPGRRVLERFLNRGQTPPEPGSDASVIRILYLDAPIGSSDSLALAAADYVRREADAPSLRARADSLAARARRWAPAGESPTPERLLGMLGEINVTPLFVVRCRVVSAAEIRPFLDQLGADAFASIIACTPEGRP